MTEIKNELKELVDKLKIERTCKTCSKGNSEGWCYGYGEEAYQNSQICGGYEPNTEITPALEAFKDILKEHLVCPEKK